MYMEVTRTTRLSEMDMVSMRSMTMVGTGTSMTNRISTDAESQHEVALLGELGVVEIHGQ